MPQIAVNSSNIANFFFSVTYDLINRRVVFDTSASSYNGSSGSGVLNVLGISFSLVDGGGADLTTIDFTDPTKYIVPSTEQEFTLDLSYSDYVFLFQKYKVIGAIKDQDGTVYQTTPEYYIVCQPVDFSESGYVPGVFQVTANCPDNVLTVKELTLFVYDNLTPYTTVSKSGTLYYPTGTISSIAFTGTPFSNDVVYTGQYRINNDSTATYNIATDIYVEVVYRTANQFDVTCANRIGDLMCCLVNLQNEAAKNCNNAIGKAAAQKMADITPVFLIGLAKEINGQDASVQADFIKKTLSCNCGDTSIGQNEMTPINPSVTNIVLAGVGGTSIATPTTVGNTKTYNIRSYVYQVTKGDTGDSAWSIAIDTTVSNTIKYVITFNYTIQAGYILDAIAASPTLLQQLNDLITSSGVDLNGLDGKCVINLSLADYVFSLSGLNGTTKATNIVINGTTYAAPVLFVTNTAGIKSWLDSLSLGVFTVIYSSGTLTVLSTGNSNTLSTFTVSSPGITVSFQSTNATLVQILQAMIDYLCELSALQMVLGSALSICSLDYNYAVVTTRLGTDSKQSDFNSTVASAICNIASRISTLTGLTCEKLKAIYQDNVTASFSGGLARLSGLDQNGDCVSYTVQQIALGVIQAVNVFANVKTAFCAIDCSSPATCPDVSSISTGIVSGNIAFYSLTWSATPSATQAVTLQYKLTSASTWITVSSTIHIFPNGNINGSTPVQILGLTPGQSYNVKVFNNCGGAGAIQIVTVPTSSIFTANYLLGNTVYLICGATPVTLYSGSSFGSGTVMYTDAGLTIPVTGYSYISPTTGGNIFTIDSGTGIVGSDTGSTCNSGTEGLYALGNNTGTICSEASQTLYTNGAFSIGGVLYSDSSLTTPVTGYDYVRTVAEGSIYNLNNATGVVGADTGLTCSYVTTVVKLSNTYNTICAQSGTTVYSSAAVASGVTIYSDSGLTTPITGYAYVNSSLIYNLNTVTGMVGAALAQNCGDVSILNLTSGSTITGVANITGFTLTGTIAPGQGQNGTHIAFSGTIQLTISGAGVGTATLRKNGSLVSSKPLSVGTITFDFNSFVVGDALFIQLT